MSCVNYIPISIHEALASLDRGIPEDIARKYISIHEALASLDILQIRNRTRPENFDPRGSREPRRRC